MRAPVRLPNASEGSSGSPESSRLDSNRDSESGPLHKSTPLQGDPSRLLRLKENALRRKSWTTQANNLGHPQPKNKFCWPSRAPNRFESTRTSTHWAGVFGGPAAGPTAGRPSGRWSGRRSDRRPLGWAAYLQVQMQLISWS